MFDAFAVSTGVVALGEIGDKTQLLALLLAARFRKPVPIVAGVLVATRLNHAAAAALGTWITRTVGPQWMRWVLGPSFVAVAVWMPIPDEADEVEGRGSARLGVFGLAVVAFFGAEMGDKTQVATVMLAARFDDLVVVTAGTTLGMTIANVPAVLLGDKAVKSCRCSGCTASLRQCSRRSVSRCWRASARSDCTAPAELTARAPALRLRARR